MMNRRICFAQVLAHEVHDSLVRDVQRYSIISIHKRTNLDDPDSSLVYLVLRPAKGYTSELKTTLAKLHKAGIITHLGTEKHD